MAIRLYFYGIEHKQSKSQTFSNFQVFFNCYQHKCLKYLIKMTLEVNLTLKINYTDVVEQSTF